MPGIDLFDLEKSVVAEIAAALRQEHLSVEDARRYLVELLANYEKLLRLTQQLIKLSDGKAREFTRLNRQLQQLSRDLEFQASHDALTTAYNKGAITEILQKHLAERDFALILLDIDHFKKINDTYGHWTGDQVLRHLAKLVQEFVPPTDFFGRFGGEEFILILNDRTLEQARETAEELRSLIAATSVPTDETEVKLTVSMGLAACRRNEAFALVYERVDKLLYAAKNNGRNRVQC